jgi:hypothetical protein
MYAKETGNEVSTFLEIWVNKIRTGDPKLVTKLYHKNGLLLGTFSNKERLGHDLILEYFENLLKSKVDVEILTETAHADGSLQVSSGLYNFIVDGKTVNARFSFVVILTDGGVNSWKILSHHSSLLPES